MLVVVSPAKKLDMTPMDGDFPITPTNPAYGDHAQELAGVAAKLGVADIQKLMDLSEKLASLNVERFANFGAQETKPAILAFAGDTYQGLEAATLDADEMAWAQNHLRILSGLYGVLRPLDVIEPYRLEMGSRLKTSKGNNLYAYWGAQIAASLNEQAAVTKSDHLINCASQEYFGAVDRGALDLGVITPVFKERKDGKSKIVSFFAKKARGAMGRYIIQNRLTKADDIKGFGAGGYEFAPDQSDAENWVFERDYPEPVK